MINDDARQLLYDECNTWVAEVEQNGGKCIDGFLPNLAGLDVYGIHSSIEGCMTFKDVQDNTKKNVWYSNIKLVVL